MSFVAAWLGRSLGWSNSRRSWAERLAVLALFLAVAGLLIWGRRLAVSGQVVLWAGLVLAAALVGRRGWLRLLGPVFFYDLVRLGRRPRAWVIRAAYALVLLAILCWVYVLWVQDLDTGPGLPVSDAPAFASSFFFTFMAVQVLVAALVTPAVVAPAVAEEKERRTLEFLLATDLRSREIVLSKLASRLVSLLVLLLTGLPVLAALQFMGGIDPGLVLAGFAATALTIASLAGLAIYNSTVCRRARDAIVLTYLMAVAYQAISGLAWLLLWPEGWAEFPSTTTWTSPVTLTDAVEWFNAGNLVSVLFRLSEDVAGRNLPLGQVLPGYLRGYALFHGVIAVLGPTLAVLRLRRGAQQEAARADKAAARKGRLRPVRALRRLGLATQPMLWKEVFAERGRGGPWLTRVVTLVLVAASLAPTPILLAVWVDGNLPGSSGVPLHWGDLVKSLNIFQIRLAGTAVACLLLVAVAVRAAGSVRGEYERQTMDSLLTTPLDSDGILFGKWLGAILSVRAGLVWLAVIGVLGVLTGALHPVGFALLGLTWLVYAAFAAGMGVWCSLWARNSLRATVWALVGTVGAGLGHWAVWMLCIPFFLVQSGPIPAVFEGVANFQMGLTPPLVLGRMLAFPLDHAHEVFSNDEQFAEMVAYAVLGTFTWAVLAAGLWWLASASFRQLAGRAPGVQPRLRPAASPVKPAATGPDVPEVLPVEPAEPAAPAESTDRA